MELAWVIRMASHPHEAQELKFALETIKPIMTDSSISREEKRKTLSMMANELSEDTFKLAPVIEQIMEIINMKEDTCREYSDAEAQVEGILSWLPRMKQHRDKLKKEVVKHRKEYGLKI